MHNAPVITLDDDKFSAACGNLMQLVLDDWRPTVLIGIRSGGFHVAEAMARGCPFEIPVLGITCRRPTTQLKMASNVLRGIVSRLPRPVVDRLRVLEHRLITRKARPSNKAGARQLDPAELARIRLWMTNAGEKPAVLIVDDSVDSGITLATVADAVRREAPPHAAIRYATITLTTQNPSAYPHYRLYDQLLCRFPWSLDAQTDRERPASIRKAAGKA